MTTFKDKFIEVRPTYEKFLSKLTSLIKELINDSKIDISSIESRTKSVESFDEKIKRPSKNYKNPLTEITDICGIRVITYYTQDIYELAKLIEKEFKIDKENSIDKTTIQSPDTFGYLSLHYVVSLNSSRSGLAEWKNFKDFKVEVQIRTILQHSWATIDHKLRYKTKREIPSVLKRKIYRLSALLELADEQFLTIKQETEKLNSEIDNSISSGNLDIEFNTLSLKSYVDKSDHLNNLVEIALQIGYLDYSDETDNANQSYFYSRLIATLLKSNLTSIEDLDTFITKYKDTFEFKLRQFKQRFDEKTGEVIFAVKTDLLIIVLVLSSQVEVNIKDEELRQKLEWNPLIETFDSILNE